MSRFLRKQDNGSVGQPAMVNQVETLENRLWVLAITETPPSFVGRNFGGLDDLVLVQVA